MLCCGQVNVTPGSPCCYLSSATAAVLLPPVIRYSRCPAAACHPLQPLSVVCYSRYSRRLSTVSAAHELLKRVDKAAVTHDDEEGDGLLATSAASMSARPAHKVHERETGTTRKLAVDEGGGWLQLRTSPRQHTPCACVVHFTANISR